MQSVNKNGTDYDPNWGDLERFRAVEADRQLPSILVYRDGFRKKSGKRGSNFTKPKRKKR